MNKENKKFDFDKIATNGQCEVCGKQAKVVVVASSLGPVSNAICKDCLSKELEPIGNIAGYLTVAGIDSYEKLRESKTALTFIEAQMQNRDASDEDWNKLWEVVKYSCKMLEAMNQEAEV